MRRNNSVVMTFQNYYPKKGKIIPAYVKEIAKILRTYPTTYEIDEKLEAKLQTNLF